MKQASISLNSHRHYIVYRIVSVVLLFQSISREDQSDLPTTQSPANTMILSSKSSIAANIPKPSEFSSEINPHSDLRSIPKSLHHDRPWRRSDRYTGELDYGYAQTALDDRTPSETTSLSRSTVYPLYSFLNYAKCVMANSKKNMTMSEREICTDAICKECVTFFPLRHARKPNPKG